MSTNYDSIEKKYKDSRINVKEVITSNGKYLDELDYLRDHITSEMTDNLDNLMNILNILREEYNKPMIISCGFRNSEHNAKVGGAKNSLHCFCGACDISDPSGDLDTWLVNHKEFLEKNKIFCEHPFYTKNWSHIQFKEPKSKNIFFIPYSGNPKERDKDDMFAFLMK